MGKIQFRKRGDISLSSGAPKPSVHIHLHNPICIHTERAQSCRIFLPRRQRGTRARSCCTRCSIGRSSTRNGERLHHLGELRNLALLGTNLLILGLQHLPEKVNSVVLWCGHRSRLVNWLLAASRLKQRLTKLLLVLRLLCKLLLW